MPSDEVERRVNRRRLKRRLKAAASVLIAVAAGTFIACSRRGDKTRPNPAPNPSTDEISNLPAPPRADPSVSAEPSADASPTASALAIPSAKAPGAGHHGVDRDEHRKGMPVRDNLLE